jgi:hypothetical protein
MRRIASLPQLMINTKRQVISKTEPSKQERKVLGSTWGVLIAEKG